MKDWRAMQEQVGPDLMGNSHTFRSCSIDRELQHSSQRPHLCSPLLTSWAESYTHSPCCSLSALTQIRKTFTLVCWNRQNAIIMLSQQRGFGKHTSPAFNKIESPKQSNCFICCGRGDDCCRLVSITSPAEFALVSARGVSLPS